MHSPGSKSNQLLLRIQNVDDFEALAGVAFLALAPGYYMNYHLAN